MKTMKTLIFGLTISLGAVLLTSCSDDPNPLANIKLQATTTSTGTSTQTGRVSGTNDLAFTSGFITIREVVFDADNNDGTSVSRTIEQIAVIDYATGVISPEVVVTVPAGIYSSVNLGIELQDDGSAPSMVLEGTYTNSNDVAIPIRFEFNSGEVFEADATTVTLSTDTDVVGKLSWDALDWFSVISASRLDAATQTDGIIIISGTSNADIFSDVADRLDVGTQAVFE